MEGTDKADRAKPQGGGILPKLSPGNEWHTRKKCNPIGGLRDDLISASREPALFTWPSDEEAERRLSPYACDEFRRCSNEGGQDASAFLFGSGGDGRGLGKERALLQFQ